MSRDGLPRIVVFERDESTAQLIRHGLDEHARQRQRPLSFQIEGDATGALSAIRSDRPDLILLGLPATGQDGWTLLTQLKSDAKTRPVPVVVYARHAPDESVWHTYQRHANSFLHLPDDPSEAARAMFATLRFWLSDVIRFPLQRIA